jgi:hypothetical protein
MFGRTREQIQSPISASSMQLQPPLLLAIVCLPCYYSLRGLITYELIDNSYDTPFYVTHVENMHDYLRKDKSPIRYTLSNSEK